MSSVCLPTGIYPPSPDSEDGREANACFSSHWNLELEHHLLILLLLISDLSISSPAFLTIYPAPAVSTPASLMGLRMWVVHPGKFCSPTHGRYSRLYLLSCSGKDSEQDRSRHLCSLKIEPFLCGRHGAQCFTSHLVLPWSCM